MMGDAKQGPEHPMHCDATAHLLIKHHIKVPAWEVGVTRSGGGGL
jgi:hypothetical protein